MIVNKLHIASLIDAHAHLDAIAAVDTVLARARTAGIGQVVAVGMDKESNAKTLALAARFPGEVLPALGYHPWSIQEQEVADNLTFLETHLSGCIALGEVGLDYKVKVKKELQVHVLSRLLEMARKMEKPVVLHCRFSHARTHAMTAAAGIKKAVFHWYSGPLDVLNQIIADGYYISATPALAFSPPHQAAIMHMPLEKILIETDAPVAYQGKVSEPCHLLDTLHHLSLLKNLPKETLAEIVTKNTKEFLGL